MTIRRHDRTTGFDFFEGACSTTSNEPEITLRRSGQMVLTPAAVALFNEDQVSHVQLGHDATAGAVGLRPVDQGTRGRYRLREQSNGSSVVDGRRFCAHHGIKPEKATRFDAEVLADGIVGFRLEKPPASATGEAKEAPAAKSRKRKTAA